MSAWTALPQGQDVTMAPGGWYAAIASIDDPKATKASVTSAMASYYPSVTLVSFGSQGDPGYASIGTDPDSDRKRVALIVRVVSTAAAVTLPWSRGVILVRPNIYTLVSAWSGGVGKQPAAVPWTGAPAPSSPASMGSAPGALALWGIAGLAGLAAAWAGYAYRREIAAALTRNKELARA